jgi:hypothetical protein
MILQKELYEKIYDNDLSETHKKEDIYIEFGQTWETLRWANIIRANFDIDTDVLLQDALEMLDLFNDALIAPIGSELFEKAREIIKNTVLLNVVTKIEILTDDDMIQSKFPKIITLKLSSPEEDIPIIKNLLRTL